MRITTKLVVNIETGVVIEHVFYDYSGPVALLCGASDDQKDALKSQKALAQEQQNYLKVMQQQQATVFGQDQAILKSLQQVVDPMIASTKAQLAAFDPIIKAGPSQKGYSDQEEQALRSQATNTTAGASDRAVRTIDAQSASDAFVPSGAQDQLRAMTREEALNKNADLQTGITTSNYETGRQNYENAVRSAQTTGGPLATMAGAVNTLQQPAISAGNMVTGTTNATIGAGDAYRQAATDIQKANSAWMGPVFGMLGGIAGGALGGITGAATKGISRAAGAVKDDGNT